MRGLRSRMDLQDGGVTMVSTENANVARTMSIIVKKVFAKYIADKVNALHPGLTYEQAKPFLAAEYARHENTDGTLAITIIGRGDDLQIISITGEVIL